MTDKEFLDWCDRLTLPDKGLKLVQAIRSSEPSRQVEHRSRAITERRSSRKMGRIITFDGCCRIDLEAAFENNSDVLEYYTRPLAIYLDYQNKAGRRVYHPYTPDFFVIRREAAGWEEFKTEVELLKLSKDSPNRWQQNDNNWLCPPAEEYAKSLGLFYALRLIQ